MISRHTRDAIIALVNVDKAATDAERQRVVESLAPPRRERELRVNRVVKLRKAAEMLGVHRNTVKNWIRSGRLVGVRGAGKRLVGVTGESLEAV